MRRIVATLARGALLLLGAGCKEAVPSSVLPTPQPQVAPTCEAIQESVNQELLDRMGWTYANCMK